MTSTHLDKAKISHGRNDNALWPMIKEYNTHKMYYPIKIRL